MMNQKIERDLQRLLEGISDEQFLTVILKVADISALTNYLEMVRRQNVSLSYNTAPFFDVIVLSASKSIIEQVANRKEVIAVMTNRELTVPPFRTAKA
jgi:hypothetical protein